MEDKDLFINLMEHLMDNITNRPSDPFKEFVGRNIEEGINVSQEIMRNADLNSYEPMRISLTIKLNNALKHYQQPITNENECCFDIINDGKKVYKNFMRKNIQITESEAKNLLAYDSMLSLLEMCTKIQVGSMKVQDIDFEKFRVQVADGFYCENIETSKLILYVLFNAFCNTYQFETCKVVIILLNHKIQLAKQVYADRINELINILTRGLSLKYVNVLYANKI